MSDYSPPLTILVVDDDPVFALLVQACLERAGHAVQVVNDGGKAIERLTGRGFDLAMIDLSMPRVDGFRLIALIRHTPRLAKLPIMVVSSRTDQKGIEEVQRLGANGFASKPVDWATLPATVETVMRTCWSGAGSASGHPSKNAAE